MRIKMTVIVVGLLLGFGLPFPAWADQQYEDRAHWFQISLPDGWTAQPLKDKTQVLSLRSAADPGVRVGLSIHALPDLPELATRDELIRSAQNLLKKLQPEITQEQLRDVAGLPMAGSVADLSQGQDYTRWMILIDSPRHRAFCWNASASADLFLKNKTVLDRIFAGLVPAVSETPTSS